MAKAWELPDNTGPGPRDRLLFSASSEGHIALSDGSVHDLPSGTRMVVTMPRQAGDWYAEIKGAHHVAGLGDSKDAAFLDALSKASAKQVSA